MPTPTRSTIPAVKAQLVYVFEPALATAGRDGGPVQVSYAWPGPATEDESVFLGRHPLVEDIRIPSTSEIPTIKAGRKQRQETYEVEFTVWSWRPELSSDQARKADERAFAIFGQLEDVLADDTKIGLADTVLWLQIVSSESRLWPFDKGWGAEIIVTVEVKARLT